MTGNAKRGGDVTFESYAKEPATDDTSSTGSQAQMPSIDADDRTETGRRLQETLVDLVHLSLVGKQLHWSVTGPHFRPLHLHLDELVDSWRSLADVVAERAVAIGTFPDGQAAAVVDAGRGEVAAGTIADTDVVRELARQLAEACERSRTHMDQLGELDTASQDVLVDVVRALEQQLWMVRAQQS
jgi:starvation-inducible DNA-binding protein